MILIIAGGRDYQFTDSDYARLDAIHEEHQVTMVISGGATGADACGERWAKDNEIELRVFKADWKKHGKAAGPIRNERMADVAGAYMKFGSTKAGCALFPGGRGTADMMNKAKQQGLTIFDYTK